MAERIVVQAPFNRVEGDVEIRVELEDGAVADAWCSGTSFRGFERLLIGRAPRDALVITPRICGICGTAHLTAAVRALDGLASVDPPANGVRLRNIALMVEHVQSDMRHAFLTFAADFTNPAHREHSLFEEAVRRYEPFKGDTVRSVVEETKRVLGIIAFIGGQWPHSAYMLPGGVTCRLHAADLMQCRLILRRYREWYERCVLGCSLDRWTALRRGSDLEAWLEESEDHGESEIGFFLRFAREAGLDQLGSSHDRFLSFGAFDMPAGTRVRGLAGGDQLTPAGYARGLRTDGFDEKEITEDVHHSWFRGEDRLHPSAGVTEPYATGGEGHKYSWAKSPRYCGEPAETGPLAEMLVARHPLFSDLFNSQGANVLVRQLARLARPAELLPAIDAWLGEAAQDGASYTPGAEIADGSSCGLTEAARGALGHWIGVEGGVISHYQIITPTAWHVGPRDVTGIRGPTEQALVGAPVRDPENPVELGHIIRSFDHCLVCTVHTLRRGRTLSRLSIPPA